MSRTSKAGGDPAGFFVCAVHDAAVGTRPRRRVIGVVDVLAPVAVDTAYSYRAPSGSSSNPAPSSACRSAHALRPASCGPRARPAATISSRSPRSSTGRRSARRCAISSIGRPAGRWRRAACCCAWRSAPARSPQPPAPKFGLVATGKAPTRMTEARARVLTALSGNERANAQSRARRARGLLDQRHRRSCRRRRARRRRARAGDGARRRSIRISAPSRLNADQRAAADDLTRLVADRAFSTTLLEGVTGSGKTEVYFEAVAEALRQKRQALVLLPEIALTAQFLDRFAARFGARPAEWHSGLTERQRERVWTAVGRRRGARRCRRALGSVPAVRRPRPHRRR